MALADGPATAALFLTCIWLAALEVHSEYYRRPTSTWHKPRQKGIYCDIKTQRDCPLGECCVKEVISFKDLDKDLLVSARCKPLLRPGELCLKDSEGYLCDCARGLICEIHKNETYGHCAPG